MKFFDLTEIARSLTAVYQLLPIYPCYDGGDGKLARVAEARIPNLDPAKTKAALAFHHEIRDAVEENMTLSEYADARYDIRPIVGIEQPTAQSAQRDGNKVKLLRRLGKDDLAGDGTVPRPSATPTEFDRLQNAIYASERHASLQNDGDVLFQLNGILTQPSFNPSDYRDATSKIGQSLDVEDWLTLTSRSRCARVHTPIPVGCSSQSPRTPRRVRKRRRQLQPTGDGWYTATLGPLPEGLYRASSRGWSR